MVERYLCVNHDDNRVEIDAGTGNRLNEQIGMCYPNICECENGKALSATIQMYPVYKDYNYNARLTE